MRSIPAQIKSYAPGFALALIIALLAKGIEALLPFDVIGASVIASSSVCSSTVIVSQAKPPRPA